jgi:C1A family cysteine protease
MHLQRGVNTVVIIMVLCLGIFTTIVCADDLMNTTNLTTPVPAGSPALLPATGDPIAEAAGADEKIVNETETVPSVASRENLNAEPGQLGKGPTNPAFLAYQNRSGLSETKQSLAMESAAVTGSSMATIELNDGSTTQVSLEGEIPAPLDFSYTRGLQADTGESPFSDGGSYPVAYDLRSYGKVSPVKNQGNTNACWAFATAASLESSLLPGEIWDFSENNMKNTLTSSYPDGFDRSWNDGGNRFITTAYLNRWSGPILESDDPFSTVSGTSPAGLHPYKHTQNVYFLPERASATDNNYIKSVLLDTGAVQASIFYNLTNLYYNSTSASFYNDGSLVGLDPKQTSLTSTNHAITIVGWNNTYNRSNFRTVPAGDGAFIVKNSWGTGWGDSGYFYVSYYDVTIGSYCAAFTGEPVTNYDRVYSYDPLGWVENIGYGSTTASYANVFTAESAETLRAIGTYDSAPGSYTAEIYLDPSGGPVNASGYVATTSWSASLLGYHTVDVPDIALKPGQKYSVVITASTPSLNYPIPVEDPYVGYSSHASANAGESYVSQTGATWTDLTTLSSFTEANVCVKGYTTIRSKPGVVRNNNSWLLDVTGNGAYGAGDSTYSFGKAGDRFVTGDWNGDGTTEIGVVRNNNAWLLDMTGNGAYGAGDVTYTFGKAGDKYVTGDWDGNGSTRIGVVRNNNSWLLDVTGNGAYGAGDRTYTFGKAGDVPVTGDWDGDGKTEIGVVRNNNSWLLDVTGNGAYGAGDVTWTFGKAGDVPVTGDWDGDGTTEIGVVRNNNTWLLDVSGNGAYGAGDRTYTFGKAGDVFVTGAW